MFRRRRESYFFRIFTSVFCTCLLVALVICGIIVAAFSGLYSTNLRNQCMDTAEKMKDAMEKNISVYSKTLTELAESPEAIAFLTDSEDTGSILKRELYIYRNGFSYSVSVSVVRLWDNAWISTTQQSLADSSAAYSRWGVFRKANETEGVAMYSAARDALLSESTRISMAKAFRGDDGILGYFLLEVPRSTIEELIGEYSGQYGTDAMIINGNLSVIWHSGGTSEEGLGKGEDYGISQGMDGEKGITEVNYAWARSDSLGLFFLQEIPENTLTLALNTVFTAMIPGIILIVGLAFLISRALAKSVCDPIEEMIGSMEKIENGDLSVRLNFDRRDEIGQLGAAFDSMTEKVEGLMERIDEEKHSLWIAETRSLSLQMNPHFLYNTLDLIKWNAKLGRDKEVVEITVLLGRVLRRIMNTKTDLVKVSYELEIVEAFVEIQKKHYGDRLVFSVEMEDGILDCLIPKLMIQPIVENAIVHGFADRDGICRIRINGRKKDGMLEFTVEDNGCGMEAGELSHILEFRQEGSHHIGLNNVQRRARMFGTEKCGLEVSSSPGAGSTVRLLLKEIHMEEGKRPVC